MKRQRIGLFLALLSVVMLTVFFSVSAEEKFDSQKKERTIDRIYLQGFLPKAGMKVSEFLDTIQVPGNQEYEITKMGVWFPGGSILTPEEKLEAKGEYDLMLHLRPTGTTPFAEGINSEMISFDDAFSLYQNTAGYYQDETRKTCIWLTFQFQVPEEHSVWWFFSDGEEPALRISDMKRSPEYKLFSPGDQSSVGNGLPIPWGEYSCEVRKAVIEGTPSPVSTGWWFDLMENLQEITGLHQLDTSATRLMFEMFRGCKNLSSLDLSHFDTSRAEDMSGMFRECRNLKELDVTGFDVSNVPASRLNGMFHNCHDLETIYALKDTDWMQETGANSPWEPEKQGEPEGAMPLEMGGLPNLFEGCRSLLGPGGMSYHERKTSLQYARIGGGEEGYFTEKPLSAEIVATSMTVANRMDASIYARVPVQAKKAVLSYSNSQSIVPDWQEFIFSEMEMDPATGRYKLVVENIPAKEMTEIIRLEILDRKGNHLELIQTTAAGNLDFFDEEYCFRVTDYAKVLLKSSQAKYRNIGKAILNYGDMAQKFFKHRLNDLANPEGYLAKEMEALKPNAAYNAQIPENSAEIGYLGMALNLEGATELYLYFGNEVVAFDGDGNPLPVEDMGGRWRITIPNIFSNQLHRMHSVILIKNGKTYSFTACALSYANNMLASQSANKALKNVSRALYLYNKAAIACFGDGR